MPTAAITGIEDPAVLAPGAPNYFADAWRGAPTLSARRPALPRDALSLAVNSTFGRSQNQLHIHIDCLRVDVRNAVRRQLASIGDNWAPLAETFAGHHTGRCGSRPRTSIPPTRSNCSPQVSRVWWRQWVSRPWLSLAPNSRAVDPASSY